MKRARAALTALGGLLALALPLILVPLTTHTSWSSVATQLGQVSAARLALLGAVWFAGLYVHTYVTTGALPGLTHRRAMVLNFSGSTVSHLAPFGGVLGMGLNYTMLRSWGFDGSGFTVLTLLSNTWNALVKLLLPTLALVLILLCTDHGGHGLFLTAALGLLVCSALAGAVHLVLRGDADGGREPGRVHRAASSVLSKVAGQPAHDVVSTIRTDLARVVRGSWHRMSAGMVGYALLQAALLWLCLASVGAPVSPLEVFAAYATGSALSLVPITPGGVGFAEAGTAALLVAFGAPAPAVAAGVLLYSTFTRWMEIPFGAAGTAWWWIRRAAPATP